MSSVNSILDNHGKTPKDPKETRLVADKLMGQLQQEGMLQQEPAAAPKPRGRPPGSGTKTPPRAKSKSPGPARPPNFVPSTPEQFPQSKSPEEIANQMKCKRKIRKLRAYKRNFPELLGKDLAEVNPHQCSPEQLDALIDSCKEVIGDEIESRCAPDLLGSLLDQAETAAVHIAMSAEPGSAAEKLIHLRNFAQAAKSDPCIAMDLKLIACEWVGVIPQNPYLRLLMNLGRCAGEVFGRNAQAAAGDQVAVSEQFSEF